MTVRLQRRYHACMVLKSPWFMPTTYVVALDDSGQKSIRLPTEKSFGVGGVVFPLKRLHDIRRVWHDHLRLPQGQEIKVAEYAQTFGVITPDRPHFGARASLSVVMSWGDVLPVFVHTRKSKTGRDLTIPTKAGGRAVDLGWCYYQLAISVSAFLTKGGSRVRAFSDRLGSVPEEDLAQQAWSSVSKVKEHLPAVHPPLRFVDSRTHPEIQMAGVLMGLLCQSAETDEPLSSGMAGLIRKAQDRGLFSCHLE